MNAAVACSHACSIACCLPTGWLHHDGVRRVQGGGRRPAHPHEPDPVQGRRNLSNRSHVLPARIQCVLARWLHSCVPRLRLADTHSRCSWRRRCADLYTTGSMFGGDDTFGSFLTVQGTGVQSARQTEPDYGMECVAGVHGTTSAARCHSQGKVGWSAVCHRAGTS